MKKRVLAIVLTVGGILSFAPPTLAVGTINGAWPLNLTTLSYCFSGSGGTITTTERDTIRAGLNMWTNQSGKAWAESCTFPQITIKKGSIGPGAETTLTLSGTTVAYNGVSYPKIVSAVITFNSNIWTSFWKSTSTQNCYVGSGAGGCLIDMKTVAAHEWGHALGLGHSNGAGQCFTGYFSTSYASACNAESEKIMHNGTANSGGNGPPGFEFNSVNLPIHHWQGYRHTALGSAAIADVQALYGP